MVVERWGVAVERRGVWQLKGGVCGSGNVEEGANKGGGSGS